MRVEDLRTGGWDDSRRVRLKCVDISMKHFVMYNKNSLVRERFVDGMIFPFFFFLKYPFYPISLSRLKLSSTEYPASLVVIVGGGTFQFEQKKKKENIT